MLLALFLLPSASALVDCIDGFTGRMQASVQDSFITVDERRMCAAAFCIKVFIHGAFDDDEVFQQGISSRCAYTGGDRQLCVTTEGGCTSRTHYDGMHGNFTVCCCQENSCNGPMPSDLASIYQNSTKGGQRSSGRKSSITTVISIILSTFYLR